MPRQIGRGTPQKAKNTKQALLKLVRYMKSFVPVVIVTLVLVVASTVFRLVGPNQLSKITEIVQQAIPIFNENGQIVFPGIPYEMSAVWKIVITLIVLYSLGLVFTYIANVLIARVSFKISQKLRKDINEKINRLPLKYLDAKPYGDVLSTVANDVDSISQTLHQSASGLVSAVTLLLGSVIMMFVTNWILALVAIGSSLIGFVLMFLIMSKSQKYFMEQQYKLAELNGVIEEVYSGQTVVKTYNAKDEVQGVFDNVNGKLHSSAWKSQFFSGIMYPLMGFIGNFGYVMVCVVGAILATNKVIGIEVIVSFMIYVRYFTNPLSQIAQAMSSFQTAAAASERVFEFLEAEEISSEVQNPETIEKVKGGVEIENVRFGYDKNREIIHGFSAKIKSGQKVAIVGPTGAGKTTIVNLLMRFYDVDSGDIKIDGTSIYNIKRSHLRDIFAMVLQDTWLFEGTIRENLVYNKTGITDDDLDRVCEACGLTHFIKTLPHGYDTVLSDETNVSVGQKQLLTIARAMLQNSPMLILDEATSNVDTRTEELIQKAMDKLTENRTSFVIAHRLSTIKNADLILVLKDGDVIESGNHNELIKQNGFYAELYNSQFSLEGNNLID
ncbi:MAG: ABC transporter ATP-binding protein [Clostridia bacterium]|nr:ABC transporter ATP-binding protein [Clostridia bacterium]